MGPGRALRARRALRSDRVLAAVAALAVAGFRLVLSWGVGNPHLYADEAGYLGAARQFAGEGPVFALGPAPRYHPLYAAVVTPAMWLTGTPRAAFAAVLVANAALGAVTAALLYRCCRTVLGAGPGPSLAASVAALVFAGQSVLSTAAWAENLLPAAVLAWVLAVDRAARRPSAAAAAVAVAAALACWWTHPRGLVVVGVTLAAAGVIAVHDRRHRALAIGAAGALVVAFLGSRVAVVALLDPLYQGSSNRMDEGDTIARLLDLDRLGPIAERVLGQAWYQLVATAGLTFVGAASLVRTAWKRRSAADVAPVALVAVVVGLALAAASYLGEGGRADGAFYGRYVDAATPLAAAAGVTTMLRSWSASLPAAVAVAGTTAAMTAFVPVPDRAQPLVDDMVLGISGPISLVGLRYVAIAVLALVILAAMAAASARSPGLGAAVVLVAFGALALVARHDRVDLFVRYGATLDDFAASVIALTGGEPVGLRLAAEPATYGYQWFEPGWRGYAVDAALSGPRRSPWLVGPLRWPAADDAGATIVAVDASRAVGLYVLPGAEADRLRRDGAVLPDGFPGALPAAASRASITVERDGDVLLVAVRHVGRGGRWPHYDPQGGGQGEGRVRVGVVVGDELAVADLPRDVVPGESVQVRIDVAALLDELPPGDHTAVVDLFQAGHGWFRDRGSAPATTQLTAPGAPRGR